MNREQKRKKRKKHRRMEQRKINQHVLDFNSVPLVTMCQSIQLLINDLKERGYPVYDFDNKEKYVQGIQIIKGRVYFLAAEEEMEDERAQTTGGI